jgi:glucokinase
MSDQAPVVGIDLGGTNCQVGVVGGGNELLSRVGSKTMAERGPEGVTKRLAQLVAEALEEASLGIGDVSAVGIGAPGAIDFDTGTVINAPNLRWTSFPLAARLSSLLDGKPVAVENDVNAAVLGENTLGAGRNAPDALGVWVGTGIGAGIILDHKVFHGPLGTAGEIGHQILFPDARPERQRLEQLASRKSVQRIIAESIASGELSAAADLVYGDVDSITPKEIAIAYSDRDPVAVRVVDRAADLAGIAIANAIGLLSIPLVLMGGGLTEALGEPYRQRVADTFRKRLFPAELGERVEFRVTELEADAGLMGAAILAREMGRG